METLLIISGCFNLILIMVLAYVIMAYGELSRLLEETQKKITNKCVGKNCKLDRNGK